MEILFLEEKDFAFCLNSIHLLVLIHATIFILYKSPHIPNDPIILYSIAIDY
jgi:hypothetical protein